MANERLRAAMTREGVDIDSIAQATKVDSKTVERWLNGRTPHPRSRMAVAGLLNEEEAFLWPAKAPGVAPGEEATPEVIAVYSHRADIPSVKWINLLQQAQDRVDLLGYAFLFLPEQLVNLASAVRRICSRGGHVRLLLCDPNGTHVHERDELERLGGTLPARIKMTLQHLGPVFGVPGVELRLHDVHIYNAVYRFDEDMVVTPYMYRLHGYQHPALHLHRISPYGIFETFCQHFENIWVEASPLSESPSLSVVGE